MTRLVGVPICRLASLVLDPTRPTVSFISGKLSIRCIELSIHKFIRQIKSQYCLGNASMTLVDESPTLLDSGSAFWSSALISIDHLFPFLEEIDIEKRVQRTSAKLGERRAFKQPL